MVLKEITIASAHNLRVISIESQCVMGGSLAIPQKLMDTLGVIQSQQVVVKNVTRGGMELTYLIPSKDDYTVETHGSMVRFAPIGDLICFFARGLWDGTGQVAHLKFYNNSQTYSNVISEGFIRKEIIV